MSLLEKDDLHLMIKDIMNCIIFTVSLCVFVCIISAKFGDDLQICISIRNDVKVVWCTCGTYLCVHGQILPKYQKLTQN